MEWECCSLCLPVLGLEHWISLSMLLFSSSSSQPETVEIAWQENELSCKKPAEKGPWYHQWFPVLQTAA